MLFKTKKKEEDLGSILSPLVGIRTKLQNFMSGCANDIDAERDKIKESEAVIQERTAEREKADSVLRGELFKSLEE